MRRFRFTLMGACFGAVLGVRGFYLIFMLWHREPAGNATIGMMITLSTALLGAVMGAKLDDPAARQPARKDEITMRRFLYTLAGTCIGAILGVRGFYLIFMLWRREPAANVNIGMLVILSTAMLGGITGVKLGDLAARQPARKPV